MPKTTFTATFRNNQVFTRTAPSRFPFTHAVLKTTQVAGPRAQYPIFCRSLEQAQGLAAKRDQIVEVVAND